MKRSHILGMVCGYFLSRFDRDAYDNLGFGNQDETHAGIGRLLGVPAASVKNWRDEFDPVHDNHRRGWGRRPMYPSRTRAIEALEGLDEYELLDLVRAVTGSPEGPHSSWVVKALQPTVGEEDQAGSSRAKTGLDAELAFMALHNDEKLPLDGRLVDKRHDGCGFDFEIRAEPVVAAIEVKGLAGNEGGICLTSKEWATANRLGDAYFLVVVRNASEDPSFQVIQNPCAKVKPKQRMYTTIRTDWMISSSSLGLVEEC